MNEISTLSNFKDKFLMLVICFALMLNANAQTIKNVAKDSIASHKTVYGNNGEVLAWYQPQVPGAAYSHVVKLASEFIKSGTPLDSTTGLPLYLVTCCFLGPHLTSEEKFKAGKTGEDWMHNPATVYAGMVHSLVIGYRTFSGDDAYLNVVKSMLNYQLANGTTPNGWEWPKVPYASSDPFEKKYNGATKWEKDGMRGDGLHGIEPDKIGELGLSYLLFYEVTLDTTYLNAAINCADALAKNIKDVGGDLTYFSPVDIKESPWPFRVNARTGLVIDAYCSNAVEPVRLMDELIRIKQQINLKEEKYQAYQRARDIAWKWLYSKNGPMKTSIWNAYFEDIPNDPERSNRNQVSPMETARYILKNPVVDSNMAVNIPALIYWVESVFGTENMYAIKEQTACYVPMGSHTARFASICALWYEKTQNETYREKAYRYFNNATYSTDKNGVVRVGPTWPGSWFSDGYSDYIRHFLDGIAAIPEWAPEGENHLLRSSSVVQKINYNKQEINYTCFDNSSKEVLRLITKPKRILADNVLLQESTDKGGDGWTWKALHKGGVVTVYHSLGKMVKIVLN